MPIIYIEGIKTTLFGCILGFIGGKVDTALNNTRFMTSPSEFTNFQIQLPLISIFTFVRSRRDLKEKNCRDRSRQQEIVNIKCSEVLASETFAIVVLRKEFSFKISRDLGKS